MSFEMLITLVILIIAIVLFITEWVRLDVVALGVVVALVISGVLTIEQGLAGFASKPVISIAALFIVGGAVFHTGLANRIGQRILEVAGTDERRLLVIMMVSVAVLSGFISSTGVVALMLPAILSLAASTRIAPSRLFIPLAYSALLGGMSTLIGTPPNLIVADTLVGAGFEPLSFFSFSIAGVVFLAAGVLYMLVLGPRLLPDRRSKDTGQNSASPAELFDIYKLPDNLYRLRVPEHSSLVGKRIAESHLFDDYGLIIVRIIHKMPNGNGNRVNRGNVAHRTTEQPAGDLQIQADDILIVRGEDAGLGRAVAFWTLALMSSDPIQQGDLISNETGIAEVIIRPRSSLLDRTVTEIRFNSAYHLMVLEIRRPGFDEPMNVATTPLKFGDTLLVQGAWRDIFALKRLRHDFIVMGEPEAAAAGAFSRVEKAPLTLIILGAMVGLIAFNILELTTAALLAALMMVVLGCLTMDDAYASIDWKSILLIAGMLPMSTALEQVGLVQVVAGGLTDSLGAAGPLVVLGGLFLMTMLFTQVLSNTATAVLVAPVALAAAQNMGVQPQAFLIGVAYATSMAFATPIASPVNTLVMTAGNYRFGDYGRVGIPMMFIGMAIAMILLPLLWPF